MCEGKNSKCVLFDLHLDKNPKPAEVLIQHGAEVNHANKDQSTPLLTASAWGNYCFRSIFQISRNYRLVFMLTGNPDTVKLLIEKGADVNAYSEKFGSPLHAAARGDTDGHYKVVEQLIQNTATILDKRNSNNQTVLDVAKDARSNLIEK